MRKKKLSFLAVVFLALMIFPGATCLAQAQAEKAPYPAMARLDQYLMPDENSEIALARSGGPSVHFGRGRSDGTATGRIRNRGEGEQWLSLSRGTIMGRRYR